MSLLQVEGLFIGLKEGLKLLYILYVLYVFLSREKRSGLFYAVAGGFFIVLIFASPYGVGFFGSGVEAREVIVKLTGYSFGIFYLLSLILLYQYSGEELFGPLRRYLYGGLLLFPLTMALSILYFLPDVTGTVLYMREMIRLKEGYSPALLFSLGIILSIITLLLTRRAISEMSIRLFDLPQLVIFLALVKLFAGGIKGYAEFSLIPTVKSGIMKLIHDMVHQTFITVMVPDHLLLKVTTWNFIGMFFGDQFALYVSFIFLFIPLFIFIIRYIRAPVIPPPGIPSMAERRRHIKRIRDTRFFKALPVMIFMLFILMMWFFQGREEIARLYNPEPQPVIAEGGEVVIPISSPSGDLRDGAIHKFALDLDGENMRILIIKKADGGLAVCLDACEICPPEGYAQAENHLVCLYCNTPISLDTLGKGGGCNPIPLDAIVTDSSVRIRLEEIKKKWLMVGKIREGEG